ncbi:MAG: c-type cytochrome [Ardenticatenaceae bacterium]|nr:c-type cytochrome [Anaerolineales bacterium]MCB8922509.1 c-type cytochrome [Ardenticatenaceae bacterium]MCB8989978.1 c-type cytochrome [Ardenticatenaceae bacterium]
MCYLIYLFLSIVLFAGCTAVAPPSLDDQLQTALDAHQITPLDPGPVQDPAKVALGQALYFDKLLSGNRDISCATCHHPTLASGDGLHLSIGTGGTGLGPQRILGYRRGFIARNAPEVFNRGAPQWTTMFWDSRVMLHEDGRFTTPADDQLPPGLDNVLAAQAMFPVVASAEMRGTYGDLDVYQQTNELGQYSDEDYEAIWASVMARLLASEDYVTLFAAAYPDVPANELGFEYAANAIAAFEIDAFTLLNTPWDQYLAGDMAALSDEAKRGAMLFYGEAGCVRCHSGSLMTDQTAHNIAVPQIGPGKGEEAPLDFGRGRELESQIGRYAFRTPPLRNVAVTAPYMHDGAYNTLQEAVRHHLDPAEALRNYDETMYLPPDLWGSFQDDDRLLVEMLRTLDPQVMPQRPLTDAEIADLLAFLESLTDTAVYNLDYLIPASVPSGLPVSD